MSSPNPDPTSFLRQNGLALLALALVIAGYLDLRSRIGAASEPGPEPARDVTEPSPPRDARADAGAAVRGPVVTRGAPPAWECTGQIAEEMVRQSIGRHGPGVLRCYEQRAAEAPELAGTLVLRLRVDREGRVDAVHVRGIEDAELVSCAGNDVLSWRFPPPVDGTCAIVEAPFGLGPR